MKNGDNRKNLKFMFIGVLVGYLGGFLGSVFANTYWEIIKSRINVYLIVLATAICFITVAIALMLVIFRLDVKENEEITYENEEDNQSKNKIRKHHQLLLFIGERTYNRLMMNLINAKTRLMNMISINLIVLSLLSSISIYILQLEVKPKYYEIFIGASIALLIISFIISVYGFKQKIEGWEIVSMDEKDFKKYMKYSEKELINDFLHNLKKGFKNNRENYKKMVRWFDYSLYFFFFAIFMVVIYTIFGIVGVIK